MMTRMKKMFVYFIHAVILLNLAVLGVLIRLQYGETALIVYCIGLAYPLHKLNGWIHES